MSVYLCDRASPCLCVCMLVRLCGCVFVCLYACASLCLCVSVSVCTVSMCSFVSLSYNTYNLHGDVSKYLSYPASCPDQI